MVKRKVANTLNANTTVFDPFHGFSLKNDARGEGGVGLDLLQSFAP